MPILFIFSGAQTEYQIMQQHVSSVGLPVDYRRIDVTGNVSNVVIRTKNKSRSGGYFNEIYISLAIMLNGIRFNPKYYHL